MPALTPLPALTPRPALPGPTPSFHLSRRGLVLGAVGAAALVAIPASCRAASTYSVSTTFTSGDSPWGPRVRFAHTVTAPGSVSNAIVETVVMHEGWNALVSQSQTTVDLPAQAPVVVRHDYFPKQQASYDVQVRIRTSSGQLLASFTHVVPLTWPLPARQAAPVGGSTAGGPWSLGRRPFTASSSWNTPLTSAQTNSLQSLNWPSRSEGGLFWVNWQSSNGTHAAPVWQSKSTDTTVTVSVDGDSNWGWPRTPVQVRMPAAAVGAAGSDGQLIVIDGDTVWNFFSFRRTAGASTAVTNCYGRTSVNNGNGWGDRSSGRSAGTTASGASEFAGMLIDQEVRSGAINHALALSVDARFNVPKPYGEAIHADGWSNGSSRVVLREGQRLAVPSAVQLSGLSPIGDKVLQALKTYGAFDVDSTNNTNAVLRAQTNGFTSSEMSALNADIARIMPNLRLVTA